LLCALRPEKAKGQHRETLGVVPTRGLPPAHKIFGQ